MNRLTVSLLATFAAILLATALFAYVHREESPLTVPATPNAGALPTPNEKHLIWDLFGPDPSASRVTYANWKAIASRIALHFSLAALLAAVLAFRPRRGSSTSRRNPYVAETQILMAVVATAMMMVVGDSTARAFGIFAAASLVRFRTNIRDPKEITVLLICLGVGLAAGVGRWDMAVILTLFVLLSLAILEYFEPSQVFRAMEVRVETRNVDRTNTVLTQLFAKHKLDTELRELNREDPDEPLGKIVYLVNLNIDASTNSLSEEIFSADAENIDTVEWEQKKSSTYVYR